MDELLAILQKPMPEQETGRMMHMSGYRSSHQQAFELLQRIRGGLQALVGLCRDPQVSLATRRSAIGHLGAIGTPAACGELVKLQAECKDPEVIRSLELELERLNFPKSCQALLALLNEGKDPANKARRARAIQALWHFAGVSEEAFDALIREARTNPEVRARGSYFDYPPDWRTYPLGLAERFSRLLEDPQEELRLLAAFRLASMGGPDGVPQMLKILAGSAERNNRYDAIQTFHSVLDPRALAACLERLESGGEKDPQLLDRLCELVGLYPQEARSVAVLIKRLERGQPESVRAAAIRVLQRWSVAEAAEALARILPEADPPNKFLHMTRSTVRDLAVDALVHLGDKRALEPLLLKLNHPHWSFRSGAASQLGALGDPRAFEPLAAQLMREKPDSNGQAPHAMTRALLKLDAQRAVPVLLQALKTGHAWVKYDAAALLRSQKAWAALPEVRAALAEFEKPAQAKEAPKPPPAPIAPPPPPPIPPTPPPPLTADDF